jgi:long-chain acyl-CoA synthetase
VSSRFLSKRIRQALGEEAGSKIISFDNASEEVDSERFIDFVGEGRKFLDNDQLEKCKKDVRPDDLASIIYTSGTTTMPKGVMLTHRNHVANIEVTAAGIGIDDKMNRLCYLPLSHSYERMVNYVSIMKGLTIYYNESMANIVANFASVKPGILITVPLLLERIYKGVINKQEDLKGVSKLIYKSALKFALSGKNPSELTALGRLKYRIFNRLVFSKWKAMLGGKVTKIIVGGAAVSKPVYSFFVMIGIPVYEGYGLTEMAPLISYNNTDYKKAGTVGQSIANVMVKISEDGEVLTKGPNLMKGYYKHDDLTREVIDVEGWLHTGDVGEIDDDSYLKITGRKKDIFKTSSGIYVYPERIENQLKLSSFVDQVMVAGEYEDHLSALITLNKEYTLKWASKNNLPLKWKQLAANTELRSIIQSEVGRYNEEARDAHQIKSFVILADEWTIDSGELTPSMKLKRQNLAKKYRQVVSSFYE